MGAEDAVCSSAFRMAPTPGRQPDISWGALLVLVLDAGQFTIRGAVDTTMLRNVWRRSRGVGASRPPLCREFNNK